MPNWKRMTVRDVVELLDALRDIRGLNRTKANKKKSLAHPGGKIKGCIHVCTMHAVSGQIFTEQPLSGIVLSDEKKTVKK